MTVFRLLHGNTTRQNITRISKRPKNNKKKIYAMDYLDGKKITEKSGLNNVNSSFELFLYQTRCSLNILYFEILTHIPQMNGPFIDIFNMRNRN